ncbi:MAG: hypothetical protein P3X23_006315 [Thermosynechococcus sp. Uc]|uniref:hypothetical protein n=1 Tax=Thermosynechococcus sp. Uc TaxID=3034853 RepID=UPI00259E1334|nr:hypothetical protein [Thermosynechococcus sp. Uc]MDM7326711.1 hypothetical protein [Thermosynechococcus sp. Uc]
MLIFHGCLAGREVPLALVWAIAHIRSIEACISAASGEQQKLTEPSAKLTCIRCSLIGSG